MTHTNIKRYLPDPKTALEQFTTYNEHNIKTRNSSSIIGTHRLQEISIERNVNRPLDSINKKGINVTSCRTVN